MRELILNENGINENSIIDTIRDPLENGKEINEEISMESQENMSNF